MDPNNQGNSSQNFDPLDVDPNELGSFARMLNEASPIRQTPLFGTPTPRNLFAPPNFPPNNAATIEQFQQFQQFLLQQQFDQLQQQHQQQQPQPQQHQHQPQQQQSKPRKQRKRGSKQQQQQQSLVDEEDEVEIVPETQAPQVRTTRTRGGAPSIARRGGMPWTQDEEEALTKSWIFLSQNSKEGNYQKTEKFWGDVIIHFHKLMNKEPYRSYDACVSKWRDLKKELTDFISIVNKAMKNVPSGTNNVDFMERVNNTYETKNGKPFTKIKAWKVAREHVSWFKQTTSEELSEPSTDSNKRPRTSESDVGFDIDLNTEFDDDDDDFQVNTSRPTGRDKARKADAKGKGVASSSGDDPITGKWEEHLLFARERETRKQEMIQKQKELLQQYNATLADQQMLANVEVLCKMPDPNLPEGNRDVIAELQRQLRERYGK